MTGRDVYFIPFPPEQIDLSFLVLQTFFSGTKEGFQRKEPARGKSYKRECKKMRRRIKPVMGSL